MLSVVMKKVNQNVEKNNSEIGPETLDSVTKPIKKENLKPIQAD